MCSNLAEQPNVILLIVLQYVIAKASFREDKRRQCNDVQNSFISSVITWQNTRAGLKHNLLIRVVRTLLTVSDTFTKEGHTNIAMHCGVLPV